MIASSPAFSDASTLVLGASPKKLNRSNAFLIEDDSFSTPGKSKKNTSSPPSTPTKVMKTKAASSSSSPVKSPVKDVKKVKGPGKAVDVKPLDKNRRGPTGNRTNPMSKVMKAMKGKKEKVGSKIMKKPMMKRAPKKIRVLPKATHKEQWEMDMNEVIMEYNDMVNYNKSFFCPPMCTWRE